MKKIATLLAAALLLASTAHAQLQVGAGYLNSTLTQASKEASVTNGFYAGLSYNIPVVAGLGVAPGLYYSMLGGKNTGGVNFFGLASTSTESKFSESAINLPVYLNYGIQMAKDFKFFVFAGPTVQYGLSSTTKSNTTVSVGSHEGGTNGTIDNYANDYGRLNVYMGGGAGMNAGRIQVNVGFDYGLLNLYTGSDANMSSYRYNIKLGVAFVF